MSGAIAFWNPHIDEKLPSTSSRFCATAPLRHLDVGTPIIEEKRIREST
jgi:hypothetical protein